MTQPAMTHRLAAEFIGTFWLVLGGCGSAVFAANFISDDGVSLGIGFLGIALAFGLTVLTGVYAFGTISGGHFNPAVTLGAALARRVEWKAVPAYWITQVVGGLVGGLVIFLVARGKEVGRPPETWPPTLRGPFPRRLLAMGGAGRRGRTHRMFLLVILGSTDARAPKGFAGLSIGLSLTLIHLVSIPISNTSVNPARSTASLSSTARAPRPSYGCSARTAGRCSHRRRRLPVLVRPPGRTRRTAGARRCRGWSLTWTGPAGRSRA